jgi:hypothetical protein
MTATDSICATGEGRPDPEPQCYLFLNLRLVKAVLHLEFVVCPEHDDQDYVDAAFAAGTLGYVMKSQVMTWFPQSEKP